MSWLPGTSALRDGRPSNSARQRPKSSPAPTSPPRIRRSGGSARRNSTSLPVAASPSLWVPQCRSAVSAIRSGAGVTDMRVSVLTGNRSAARGGPPSIVGVWVKGGQRGLPPGGKKETPPGVSPGGAATVSRAGAGVLPPRVHDALDEVGDLGGGTHVGVVLL